MPGGAVLALMPPAENAPKEPQCYGSPAKMTAKKECWKVERMPSIDRLMNQAAVELEEATAARAKGKGGSDDDEEEDDAAGPIYTYKKSQYWSKEVEEKLGLGGADPYGLLELEDKRWRASADEIRKAYRKLVLTHHPDKKQSEEATKAAAKKESKEDKENEEGEEEEEDAEDAEFKLLSASWEMLGNNEMRRQYDSIDNFNDFLPSVFSAKKGARRARRADFACAARPLTRRPPVSISLSLARARRQVLLCRLWAAVRAPGQVLFADARAAARRRGQHQRGRPKVLQVLVQLRVVARLRPARGARLQGGGGPRGAAVDAAAEQELHRPYQEGRATAPTVLRPARARQ